MIIKTKFIGPTCHRGARLRVSTDKDDSQYFKWDHGKDIIQNHMDSADHFLQKNFPSKVVVNFGFYKDEGYAYCQDKVDPNS